MDLIDNIYEKPFDGILKGKNVRKKINYVIILKVEHK